MLQITNAGVNKTCFIISPIGNKLAPTGTSARVSWENNLQMWEEVFEPACAAFGLDAIRSDKIAETGDITDQIFQYLRDADIVIADLSGANANVMYELGLRHTRNKLTIQIGEHDTLPFDVNTIRTIQFKRTEGGRIEARNSLIKSLESGLQGKGTPVSATRIWNELTPITKESVAQAVRLSHTSEDDEDADDNGPGIMDMLAEGESSMEEVTVTLGEMLGILNQITDLYDEAKVKIGESDAKKKGFAGRLLVARQLASSLAVPTETFEEIANEYLGNVKSLDAMITYILTRMSENPEEIADGQEFLTQIINIIDTVDGWSLNMAKFRENSESLRKISKDLAPISKNLGRSINRLESGNDLISAWRDQAEKLMK